MTDEKRYTQAEMDRAVLEAKREEMRRWMRTNGWLDDKIERMVCEAYPLPKVLRARITDPAPSGARYTIPLDAPGKGQVFELFGGGSLVAVETIPVEDAAVVAKLLANPTEEVEE